MKLVFLFGAGASYGSESVHPYPPPLGDDLADKLSENLDCIRWRHIKKSAFSGNFEKGFSNYTNSGLGCMMMIEMAVFFAQFKVHHIENNSYSKLIDTLDQNDLLSSSSFTSLNYDCIFESVLFKKKIKYFHELGNNDNTSFRSGLPIYKIHGSCNFVPSSENFKIEGASFSLGVKVNVPISSIDIDEVQRYWHKQAESTFGIWPLIIKGDATL